MKNKEFKSILNEWNTYLINESTSERVKRMIDELSNLNAKIIIKEKDKDSIVIKYNRNDPFDSSTSLYGSIDCKSSKGIGLGKADTKGIGQGEVNSTWYVTLTSRTTDGMGPLLYEVLIEYISSRKNAALKPDAGSVSDEARAVWEKFDNRSDIKKIQLDVDSTSITSYRRRVDINQLTPDNVKDDTKQYSAIQDKGPGNWDSSSLSRAYRKDDTDLIDDLAARKLIIMPKKPRSFKSRLGSMWSN